jgi:hypothetical protein
MTVYYYGLRAKIVAGNEGDESAITACGGSLDPLSILQVQFIASRRITSVVLFATGLPGDWSTPALRLRLAVSRSLVHIAWRVYGER